MDVTYARESYPGFGPEEFVNLLQRSTLAERRPVGEPGTIRITLVQTRAVASACNPGAPEINRTWMVLRDASRASTPVTRPCCVDDDW